MPGFGKSSHKYIIPLQATEALIGIYSIQSTP